MGLALILDANIGFNLFQQTFFQKNFQKNMKKHGKSAKADI